MSTDRDTTRIVRSWLKTDEHESADSVLDAVLAAVDTIPQHRATSWPARRLPEMNTAAKVALLATAAVLVMLVVRLMSPPIADVGPQPVSTLPVSTPTAPPQTPSPTLEGGRPHPWPNSGGNLGREYGPGLYFWDGTRGWMHNGYQDIGAGEGVSMTFALSDGEHERGPIAITVAGRDGTYEEYTVGVIRSQVWTFDVEGKSVTITLELQPKSTAEEVAEARGIVDSIRVESSDNRHGFRLLFTLPGGWDSG